MFRSISSIHKNVVNVTEDPWQTRKHLIHLSLEDLWCTRYAKWQLVKQNRPNGVMNVVNSLDSLARGICQNPLFASNLLNIFAPDSCARVVSTFGMGWTSRSTLSLSGLRSTQMRTAPNP